MKPKRVKLYACKSESIEGRIPISIFNLLKNDPSVGPFFSSLFCFDVYVCLTALRCLPYPWRTKRRSLISWSAALETLSQINWSTKGKSMLKKRNTKSWVYWNTWLIHIYKYLFYIRLHLFLYLCLFIVDVTENQYKPHPY